MSGLEQAPLTSVITKFKTVTSGTTMVTRAPYPNGQYYRVRKIECSTMGPGASGIVWRFWDQDLSSTTAGTVGSGGSALIHVTQPTNAVSGVAWASGFGGVTITRGMDNTPRVPFYAGITCHTILDSHITLELEVV